MHERKLCRPGALLPRPALLLNLLCGLLLPGLLPGLLRPAAAQSCVTLPSGLASWWRAEGNANDSIGGNDGTLKNGATFAAGKVGQAFSFDGVDDVVEVPNTASLNFSPTSPMTIELWAYRTGSAPIMHIVGKRVGCGGGVTFNYQLALNAATGDGLVFGANGEAQTKVDLPLNVWTHLAGTFDGTTFRLYVNGALAASSAGSLGPTNTQPLKIGGSGDCAPFGGLLDEVRLYNRALSAAEIQAIFLTPPSLVSWWRTEGNANDSIGGNDGTLKNGATFAAGKVGQAFSLDGVDDYVLVPYSESFNFPPAGQFTIESWVRLEANDKYKAILVKSPPGGVWDWGLWCDNTNHFIAGHHNEATAFSTTVAQSGVWYHVAVTYQNGSWKMYVNGALESQSSGVFITQSSGGLALGRKGEEPTTLGEPGYFPGLVDEPSLYNRALSAAEIQDIYAADSAGKCVPPSNLSINDVSVTEGNIGTTNATFTVSLSAASSQTVTVKYRTSDGTAVAPGDYTAVPDTLLTFAPGVTSRTVTVPVAGDAMDEPNETFNVKLSAAVNALLADSNGVGTIVDDDAPPSLSIADVSVTEGNSGSVAPSFIVTLSGASGFPVSVSYATADGTATQPGDYTARSGTLTILAGQTSANIFVPVKGDTTIETDETFLVNLSAPNNATIADGQATGTIRNDDFPRLSISGSSVTEDESGPVNVVFTITLSEPSPDFVTVDFATSDGTATAGADYVATSGSRTFLPGATSKTVSVAINDDNIDEADETFFVTLSNPVNALIAPALPRDPASGHAYEVVTATLNWDDARTAAAARTYLGTSGHLATITSAGEQSFITNTFGMGFWLGGIQPAGSPEPAGGYTWVTGEPFVYTNWNGGEPNNAGGREDAIGATAAGKWNDVPRTDTSGSYLVEYEVPPSAQTDPGKGVAIIVDNDAAPQISIADVQVVEGSGGTTDAVFTLTVTGATEQPLAVDLSTVDGTATAGSDYLSVNRTVVVPAGQSSVTTVVPVVADTAIEGDETFVANLSNPFNATLGDAQAQCTIVNDDYGLGIADVTVTEGSSGTTVATFAVTLAQASAQTLTVNYATANGTATGGSDFSAKSGTLTFQPGQTSKTITLGVVGDTRDEINEQFAVNLLNPANAFVLDAGTCTILDDDAPPSLSINDVTVAEGAQGSTTVAAFTVRLSAPSGKTVTVSYVTANDTALAGSDYGARSGTVTFQPGQTAKAANVNVMGDNRDELDEQFLVNLSNPANATIEDGQGSCTIDDDDPPPTISINDVTVVEGAANTTAVATFTVKLSALSTKTVTVDYTTASGTATAGSDYVAKSGTVTFYPGQTSKPVSIGVIGDGRDEPDETFFVNLSNAANGTIGDAQGIGTINNDDAPAGAVSKSEDEPSQ